jgi:hypothetical protein
VPEGEGEAEGLKRKAGDEGGDQEGDAKKAKA